MFIDLYIVIDCSGYRWRLPALFMQVLFKTSGEDEYFASVFFRNEPSEKFTGIYWSRNTRHATAQLTQENTLVDASTAHQPAAGPRWGPTVQAAQRRRRSPSWYRSRSMPSTSQRRRRSWSTATGSGWTGTATAT